MKKSKKYESTDDSNSISEAFFRHQKFLKRFLSRFLSSPHDIEDVVQDVYLKAYTAETKQKIHSPKAFLFRVARNAALKELSRKSKKITGYIEEVDPAEVISDELSVEDLVQARQKLGLFCQSAMEMPPRCRQVFLMVKVYGFSYQEIASQLEISVSAVEKHVSKGLEVCSRYVRRMEAEAVSEIPTNPGAGEKRTAEIRLLKNQAQK